MRVSMILIGLGLTLGFATSVWAKSMDCEPDKLKAAGKYSFCRLKAASKAVKKSEAPDYTKCDSRFSRNWQKAESTAAGACPTESDLSPIQARMTDDADDIVTLLGGGSVPGCPLLASGQMTCWDSGGAVVTCAGTGHDGEIQAGATLSYVDNGDGTITDLNTGLMWAKKSDDGSIHDWGTSYSWDDFFAVHVAGLNDPNSPFAGYTDWQVPNVRELQSIIDYETDGPPVNPVFNTGCVPGCTVTTCSCTGTSHTWSSTSYAGFETSAWGVWFDRGDVETQGKSAGSYVRAVRGGL